MAAGEMSPNTGEQKPPAPPDGDPDGPGHRRVASGGRLARGVAYLLDGPGSNPYARPVENLVALLDRDTGEVLEIEDGDVVPVPREAGRYDPAQADHVPRRVRH